jgi:hypothetical protein
VAGSRRYNLIAAYDVTAKSARDRAWVSMESRHCRLPCPEARP